MSEGKSKSFRLRVLEEVILITIYMLIFLLASFPTIFFFIPKPEATIEERTSNCTLPQTLNIEGQPPLFENLTLCPSCPGVSYEGGACREPLLLLQSCLNVSELKVSPLASQPSIESFAASYASVIANSESRSNVACVSALLPFMCHYLYSPCDGSGVLHVPSRRQCEVVSTMLCEDEWKQANIAFPGLLPNCSLLPDDLALDTCVAATVARLRADAAAAAAMNITIPSSSPSTLPVNCSDNFYRSSDGTCLPECGKFKLFDHTTIVTSSVFLIIACAVGLLSSIVILCISFLRCKRMWKYPNVIILYGSITTGILLDSVLLVGYIGGEERLFCSSRNFIYTNANESVFCDIAGPVGWYVELQITLLWAFHVSSLYWSIRFPFSARRLRSNNRIHFLHLAVVLLSLFLPAIPVIAALSTQGYTHFRNLAPICSPQNGNVTFFCSVLPTSILIVIGICMMIRCLFIIFKENSLFQVGHSEHKNRIAQVKLMILLCYYLIVAIVFLVVFSALFYDFPTYVAEIVAYFLCEGLGNQPGRTCSRSTFENFSFPVIFIIVLMFLAMFPAVNLVYAISVQEVRSLFGRCLGRESPSSNTATYITGQYRRKTNSISVMSPTVHGDGFEYPMTGTMSLPRSSDIDTNGSVFNGSTELGVTKFNLQPTIMEEVNGASTEHNGKVETNAVVPSSAETMDELESCDQTMSDF